MATVRLSRPKGYLKVAVMVIAVTLLITTLYLTYFMINSILQPGGTIDTCADRSCGITWKAVYAGAGVIAICVITLTIAYRGLRKSRSVNK